MHRTAHAVQTAGIHMLIRKTILQQTTHCDSLTAVSICCNRKGYNNTGLRTLFFDIRGYRMQLLRIQQRFKQEAIRPLRKKHIHDLLILLCQRYIFLFHDRPDIRKYLHLVFGCFLSYAIALLKNAPYHLPAAFQMLFIRGKGVRLNGIRACLNILLMNGRNPLWMV